ncbi:hypothetical protein HK105_204146 [Polyrhizophydium stewartii]|uniref:DUF1279 domain-containing protein n=1 Tax=Polyrhizophydium stewartii TaxID=2732419 RepID=A0ABR4NA22_9FUNG
MSAAAGPEAPPPPPNPTTASSKPLRGWRKYAHQFRGAPGSHLTAFAILHELTAIIPLPLVYYALAATDMRVPFPEDLLAEGNRRMARLMQLVGIQAEVRDDSQVMLHMATSYAVVKMLMPVRVALSFMLTPWLAAPLHRIASAVPRFWRRPAAAPSAGKAP